MWEWKGVDKEEVMSHTIRSYSIVCRARFTEESLRWVNLRTDSRLKDRFCTKKLCPRTRPTTFLNYFALELKEGACMSFFLS